MKNSENPSRARILLVEDHDANILVTGTFLEHAGYAHDVAKNGLEAFEKFRESSYAAVLMDVKIPGICGYEATRMIRALERLGERPRTPIIGLTAHATAEARARCLDAGMNDYLAKPVSFQALKAKLDYYRDLSAKKG